MSEGFVDQRPDAKRIDTSYNSNNQSPADAAIQRILTPYEEYLTKLSVEKQKQIAQLARQVEFEIEFSPDYDPTTGQLIKDGLQKVYRRRKISTKDFWNTERLRAVMNNTVDKEKLYEIQYELYTRLAFYYLEDPETGKSMSKEEFNASDWEVIRLILDACNHAAVWGRLPLEQRKSGV